MVGQAGQGSGLLHVEEGAGVESDQKGRVVIPERCERSGWGSSTRCAFLECCHEEMSLRGEVMT